MGWIHEGPNTERPGLSSEYDKPEYKKRKSENKPIDLCGSCAFLRNLNEKNRELKETIKRMSSMQVVPADLVGCNVTGYVKKNGKRYVEVSLWGKRVLAEMPKEHYRLIEEYMDGGDVS